MEAALALAGAEVVFALRPEFAQMTYEGKKKYEFRRAATRVATGATALIYEVAPVHLITGAFRIGDVCCGSPQDIAALEPDETLRLRITEYLAGARVAAALEILTPVRFRTPVPITAVPHLRAPPQSYVFLRP